MVFGFEFFDLFSFISFGCRARGSGNEFRGRSVWYDGWRIVFTSFFVFYYLVGVVSGLLEKNNLAEWF